MTNDEYRLTHASLNLDDLRRLFDLAVDSPLICSGSFEDDDVELLGRLAATLGVDPWDTVTRGTDFEARHVHPFQRRRVFAERRSVGEWIDRAGNVLGDRYVDRSGVPGDARYRVRDETSEGTAARIAEERADTTCQVSRCGKPQADPIHAHPKGEQ